MNYMSEVAKMLGVELDEKFELKSQNDSCYTLAMFTDDGLKIIETNISDQCFWKPYALENLLKGNYIIKRKPWKPQENKEYWCVDADGTVCEFVFFNSVDADHMNYYKLGNCYRTKEAAEANRDKWIAFYKSDDVLTI